MTVLYGIGTVLRFILRIALLPVQAILTLLILAIGFIGGLANIVCWLLGAFFVFGGICSFINGICSSWMARTYCGYYYCSGSSGLNHLGC